LQSTTVILASGTVILASGTMLVAVYGGANP